MLPELKMQCNRHRAQWGLFNPEQAAPMAALEVAAILLKSMELHMLIPSKAEFAFLVLMPFPAAFGHSEDSYSCRVRDNSAFQAQWDLV